MPVEQVPGPVAVEPVAQPVEADVRGIVRVVVDAGRRAVGDEHVGGRQLAGELARLALAVPGAVRRAP